VDDTKPRYEHFKLGLDSTQEKGNRETKLEKRYPSITTLPYGEGEHCERLVVDYLSALRKQAANELHRTIPSIILRSSRLDYIVTVPAMWSDKAKATARSCAERAGMGDGHSLQIISEPEAAAIYAFDAMDPDDVHVDDTFVICDVGGGYDTFLYPKLGWLY
jgi:molecular chaperone DnaK (HSP70)